jgi:hypothetical protein
LAIAARLRIPLGSFHLDSDCPVDMDPEITPEFKAELERRASEHQACPHDRQLLPQEEIQGDRFLGAFTATWSVASRCARCRAVSFHEPASP